MAVKPATRDYQRAQVSLRAMTYRDVARLWALLDPERLDATFTVFAAAVLQMIRARRAVSAGLAVAYLRDMRAGVASEAPVVDTPLVETGAVLTSLRVTSVITIKSAMTAGVSLEEASKNALVRTMGAVDKYVGDGGRELIRASVDADPAARGWVRRTLGTCDYCAGQAAGAHVESGTADFPRHDHCGCQPEPVYDGAPALPYATAETVDAVASELSKRTGITLRPSGLSVEQARLLAARIELLHREFPDVLQYLDEVGALGSNWDEMLTHGFANGFARPGKVAILPSKIADAKLAAERFAKGERSTPDPMHVVNHEVGHQLAWPARTRLLDEWKASGYAKHVRGATVDANGDALLEDVLLDIMRSDGARIPLTAGMKAKAAKAYLRDNLSTYGATDVYEAVAECFAEVSVKGAAARPFAKAVVAALRAVIRKP